MTDHDETQAELVLDHDGFEAEMEQLAGRIVRAIVEDLKEAGIAGEKLQDLAGTIAFSVLNTIDGSESHEDDEEDAPMVPILTFGDDSEPSRLIWSGSTSWMHETVYGWVDDILAEE